MPTNQVDGTLAESRAEEVAATLPDEVASEPEAQAGSSGPAIQLANPQLRHPVAVFTCKAGGSISHVSTCLAKASMGAGSLRIRNGLESRSYSSNELVTEFLGAEKRIDLAPNFNISVQANGSDYAVLRLEIVDEGRVVFNDEASAYQSINVSGSQVAANLARDVSRSSSPRSPNQTWDGT